MAVVDYDLVVRDGLIVDGSGRPAVAGDVAVSDGVIVSVGGHAGGRGKEEVDADGLAVAPGFIDPHTHLDGNLFWDPDLTPSSSFGVTTVITTNCGYGLAPVLDEDARRYVVSALSTVEQIPKAAIEAGVPFDWDDLPSYAARLDALDVLVNHAFQIGHVPLRTAVLGADGAHERVATTGEIGEMQRLLRQGLDLGAVGFSTDQVVGNPGPDGTALPGQVCAEEELISLARVLGKGPGPGLFTMANAALLLGPSERREDLAWHERLAAASGRPVVVGPVFDSHDDPGVGLEILDLVAAGRRPGVRVVPQISTRPFELWTRLDAPGMLVRALPSWHAAVRSAGADGVRSLRGDPEALHRLRLEGASMAATPVFSGRWEHVFIRYSHQPGACDRSLASLSAERRRDPVDILLDLAQADRFETQVATVMRNGDDQLLGRMVAHPAAMIGASDAGAHVLANTDSCYAVWTLQHWVRERQILSLERAISMLTAEQAALFGLSDRGRLAPALAADLVVFDPDRVATTGVRFADDQPGGCRRLVPQATGVHLSVVNGVVATRDGRSTGSRSGRRLRPVA